MRLNCEIDISYRQLHCQGNVSKKRSGFSTLSLSRKPGKREDPPVPLLIICTAQNPSGTKYNVKSNIEQVFAKFVNEGKATIRVKQPQHDIIIKKADALQLRGFLSVLRSALRGEDSIHFSQPPTKVAPPKENMTILKQRDYPLRGFPQTLKKLSVLGCRLSRIDSRVTALKQLSVLDLSDNMIERLPPALGKMALTQLTIKNNRIRRVSGELFRGVLGQRLQVLNISQNRVTALPPEVCHMRSLSTLHLQENQLCEIPAGIGWLSATLRNLDISKNAIQYLPSSMRNLSLNWLSVSENPLVDSLSADCSSPIGFPSLLHIAGNAVVRCRKRVTAEDVPATLLEFLAASVPCESCTDPVLPQVSHSTQSLLNVKALVCQAGTLVQHGSDNHVVNTRGHICRACYGLTRTRHSVIKRRR